ncbi:protein of unknown function [Agrobacterium pusense]|uniref:Uncharacterized protein n=1 Tax=Agrobacterium pusense TaxID=648995 RepID=U4QBX7_9HYPH|nr:protein of unknown function [Agrobacterium pusense]
MVYILTAGLLTHGFAPFICLPAFRRMQWHDAIGVTRMSGNPLTVAGAATALGDNHHPHRVPY